MIYVPGRVYAARVASPHPMASTTVAVKRCWTDGKVKNPMLLATLLVRGNFSGHFFQDDQLMSGAIIGHPAIPHIYAYGRSQCLEYIALERLGPSIDSCLRERGMLDMRGGLAVRSLGSGVNRGDRREVSDRSCAIPSPASSSAGIGEGARSA